MAAGFQVGVQVGAARPRARFLERQDGYRSTSARRLGIRLFAALNSLLIGQRITDNTSGFRAYDRRAIEFLARHYAVRQPPDAI